MNDESSSATLPVQKQQPPKVGVNALDNNDVEVGIEPDVKGNSTIVYLCSCCVFTCSKDDGLKK